MRTLNPRQFLLYGGIILVALGVSGLFLFGPTPDQSILGKFFWLDRTENIAHLLFGGIALAAYNWLRDEVLVRWLVLLIGFVAAFATLAGILNAGEPGPNIGIANLESPADNILHFVVSAWAFLVTLAPTGKTRISRVSRA